MKDFTGAYVYEGLIVKHHIKKNTVDVYVGSVPEIDGEFDNGLDLTAYLSQDSGGTEPVDGEVFYDLPLVYSPVSYFLEPKHVDGSGSDLMLHYALLITKTAGDPEHSVVFPMYRRFVASKNVKINNMIYVFGSVQPGG